MFTYKNINKSYQNKIILDNISIDINKQSAVGVLGVNGSGKSTLLNILSNSNYKTISGYIPQENPLMEDLNAIDNIRLWTKLNKLQIIDFIENSTCSLLGVQDFLYTKVKKMSGGMKKRLSIIIGVINQPSILFLDEPLASLDLICKHDIITFLNTFKSNGGTIVIASHDENILNFCDKVYLLSNGTLTDTTSLKGANSYYELLKNNGGNI